MITAKEAFNRAKGIMQLKHDALKIYADDDYKKICDAIELCICDGKLTHLYISNREIHKSVLDKLKKSGFVIEYTSQFTPNVEYPNGITYLLFISWG